MGIQYRRVSSKLVIVGIFLFGFLSLAVSNDNEPDNDQYNHILKKSKIVIDGEVDVLIREILFPPGWKAPTHFHNADLFIYVIHGEFEVTMEHTGRIRYSAGQAFEMRSETIMDARNPSDTNPLKLAVFQVGAPNSPFAVPVKLLPDVSLG